MDVLCPAAGIGIKPFGVITARSAVVKTETAMEAWYNEYRNEQPF